MGQEIRACAVPFGKEMGKSSKRGGWMRDSKRRLLIKSVGRPVD
jgi:hypothetical protein